MNKSIPGESFSSEKDRLRGRQLLQEAEKLFSDRQAFLKDRERNKRYRFGDQFSDTMTDPQTGETITEEQYIINDNRTPIINNLIGKTVRNLVGQFRTNQGDAVVFSRNRQDQRASEMMTNTLQANLDKNIAKEVDAREFEEFMISGVFGWKITYHDWDTLDMEDALIEQIDQSRFFYNLDAKDVRMFDVTAVGQLHDMTINDVVATFGEKPGDEKKLRKAFPYVEDHNISDTVADFINEQRDFYIPDNLNLVRVIEYWKKEYGWKEVAHDHAKSTYDIITEDWLIENGIPEEFLGKYKNEEFIQMINNDRLDRAMELGVDESSVRLIEYDSKYTMQWKVYYLSPNGDILHETFTPYDHQEHPFAFGAHPLIDGEIQSLVSSIIDQQRFVNRMIQMMDLGMSQGIKNLMWIPTDMIPEGMSRTEFADQSVEYNGMMFYDPKHNQKVPQPISNNSNFMTQVQVLQIMIEMIENISSVNDAVMGNEPQSNTPASLYAQRTSNALISNKDYFDYFFSVLRRRNMKIIKVIKQYYEEPRYVRVAGTGSNKGVEDTYDPDSVRGLEFGISIGESEDTLAYRQLYEQNLKEYLLAQYITFEEFLSHSNDPGADRLLETVQNRKNDLMGQQLQSPNGQLLPAQMNQN